MRFGQGLVAQWTRARGYGPRCRGFESLLARLISKKAKGKKSVFCLFAFGIKRDRSRLEKAIALSVAITNSHPTRQLNPQRSENPTTPKPIPLTA